MNRDYTLHMTDHAATIKLTKALNSIARRLMLVTVILLFSGGVITYKTINAPKGGLVDLTQRLDAIEEVVYMIATVFQKI